MRGLGRRHQQPRTCPSLCAKTTCQIMLVVAAFGKKYLPTTLQAFLVRTKKLVARIGWERLPKNATVPRPFCSAAPQAPAPAPAPAWRGYGLHRRWAKLSKKPNEPCAVGASTDARYRAFRSVPASPIVTGINLQSQLPSAPGGAAGLRAAALLSKPSVSRTGW
jgi:hypothetical protein